MEKPDLNALRLEIDRIDADIHELLKRRFVITGEVSKAKGAALDPTLIPRPSREAHIIETRVAAHQGDMPVSSLLRIWREIMGAACHQQGDFQVGVAGDAFGALALAARSHFGTAVRLRFGTVAELAARLNARQLALIVQGSDQDIPGGLFEIGVLNVDGAALGRLLSPHALEA